MPSKTLLLPWPRSLRARLLVVYALGMVFSVVLAGSAALLLAEPFNRFMLRHATSHAAQAFSRRIHFSDQGRPVGFDETKIERRLLTTFKTPLALMRAEIEQDPPQARNPHLLEDIDRMGRQVQQLLHLAEASEARNYVIEPVDPLTAVAEVFGYMERAALLHGVGLVMQVEPVTHGPQPASRPPLQWMADRGALFTLMKNLLENSMQHSPSGAAVTVHVKADGFAVSDQGPGVAPAELGQLFDRFWRGAQRRDLGAGLGLSICSEIARNHGWTIEARLGEMGLRMEVGFNAAAA